MASWEQSGLWPTWQHHRVFFILTSLVLVAVIGWVATEVCLNLREARTVGFEDRPAPSIDVSARGEVSVVPDVATIDLGVTVLATTASAAQDANTEKMNEIVAAMQSFGIPPEDLKTSSYSVYPRYDYDVSPAAISGYEATQSLTVKIRDMDLAGDVIEKAGELGANMIGSLRFEVDDETAGLAEAREEAIAAAKLQAQSIVDAMGRKLGPIVSYSESQGGSGPIYVQGNAVAEDSAGGAPDVQQGSTELTVSVSVTYGIE